MVSSLQKEGNKSQTEVLLGLSQKIKIDSVWNCNGRMVPEKYQQAKYWADVQSAKGEVLLSQCFGAIL